ncbi:MAG: Bax inhibitor-1/YccA family protein [Muribaculaceae bacterium]|nr:Bax inhibitor-1/YccA family protein [Muribaculaceae bacterium]
MNELNYLNGQQGYGSASAMQAELSMSSYIAKTMQRVFGKMFLGILVTAFVSLGIASSPSLLEMIFSSRAIFWVLIIAQFGVVIWLSAGINKMSATTASLLFYVYSALTGVTLTPIFFVYTGDSIVKTFFITSATFGVMAAYGYITKKDLSKMGSILFMALIGLIVVSLVNFFLASPALTWAISLAGVAIFVGLTAWDTQKIKQMALETDEQNVGKLAAIGALTLYLDFINLFLYLLRIFGSRR